jgi:hypothetical protein
MAIGQALLFVAAIAGLLSIVPLATWAATGSLRSAWEALKGYMLCMGILAGFCLLGVLAALIGSIST